VIYSKIGYININEAKRENMKSTKRLVDNLIKDDFRKCKVDLEHAVDTIMKQRVHEKKQEYIKQLNQD
jgi:hypothetical protein